MKVHALKYISSPPVYWCGRWKGKCEDVNWRKVTCKSCRIAARARSKQRANPRLPR